MNKILIGMACVLLQAACTGPMATPVPPPETPLPIPTASPTAMSTLTPLPATATASPSASPTLPPATPTPTVTRTRIPATRTPTVLPSPSQTASPSPIPGPAQVCANLAAHGTSGIFVVDIVPDPPLVWDAHPHLFRVGVCNTLPPSAVPQGRYRILLYFPTSTQGHQESVPSPADLHPGLNIVTVGPWVAGLENHRAICATKETAEVEVTYNDLPDPIYRALPWPDGKTRTYLPVQCGGDYA